MLMKNESTIVAISTPVGTGGISIIRMSGCDALKIAKKVFKSKKELSPRQMVLGEISTQNFNEKCMCVYFKEPNSFTGEDMVEFQCHGGVSLTNGVLNELLEQGATLATNGEFSKRAFLNGKLNLSQAEGMIDMINAESEAEIRAGYELLKGHLAEQVQKLQDELKDLIAEIEVSFDYPENDYEDVTKVKAEKVLKDINNQIKSLLKTSTTGKVIKDGVNVLIIGEPNVGKSSLLNALLNENKAIVTSTAGTTRDVIEGKYLYKGVKFNLIDTAGIHETNDEIESIGIEKAKQFIDSADIILHIIDSSIVNNQDSEIIKLLKNKTYYTIKNKIDCGDKNKSIKGIEISAKTKKGIEELKEFLYTRIFEENINQNGIMLTNQRHIESLKKSQNYIENALKNIDFVPLDVLSVDINASWQALGEITGQTSSEDIIDTIFSKFCLGK